MTEQSPPRRQSVADPDLDWDVAMRTEVFLDGVRQESVTAYDCDEGWLTSHVLNAEGKAVFDHPNGNIVIQKLTGTVTVAWKADQ